MNMDLFHFLRPEWLLALAPCSAVMFWLFRRYRRHSGWHRIVAAELLPYVLHDSARSRRAWPFTALAVAVILSILALAGPTWEQRPRPVFRSESALVIVLDLSRSMDAGDIKPSRLARARFKIADILKIRQEGQTALVVYAADAFTVAPLTDDNATIAAQLPALTTDLVPAQGSRVDRALALAGDLLRQASLRHGQVLLLTDEVPMASGLQAARQLVESGYRLSVLGIGTAAGAPIPMPGGMLEDADGNMVIARLDVSSLRELARVGRGRYAGLSADDRDIQRLGLDARDAPAGRVEAADGLSSDDWVEFGPWLLLPVLLLAPLAFRKGLLLLVLVVLLPLPEPAQAFAWRDLWQTVDQQAQRLFEQDKPEQSAALFNDPAWRASANYKAGHYAEALADFRRLEGSEARYNEANTLARMGRLKEALAAYDKALAANPQHADARYNRELVEQQLQRQQKSSSSDSNDASQDQSKGDGDASGNRAPEQDPNEPQDGQQTQSGSAGQNGQREADRQGKPGDAPRQGEQQDPGDGRAQAGNRHRSGGDRQDSEAQSESPQAQQQRDPERDRASSASSQAAQDSGDSPDSVNPSDAADQGDGEQPAGMGDRHDDVRDERQLARKQWLERIPDDPAGLLKRKFQYQYKQRARTGNGEKPW